MANIYLFVWNQCQKAAQENPLNTNSYSSGNLPKPLTTESSQEVGDRSSTTSKNTGSAQVNKTRGKKTPEIYFTQFWQVFHKTSDWKWLSGDEWCLSKDCRCLIVTLLFAVLWFKHTLSNAREAFSLVNKLVTFCRSSPSFMWYFSASLRRTFSLNKEREVSSNCLNSVSKKNKINQLLLKPNQQDHTSINADVSWAGKKKQT